MLNQSTNIGPCQINEVSIFLYKQPTSVCNWFPPSLKYYEHCWAFIFWSTPRNKTFKPYYQKWLVKPNAYNYVREAGKMKKMLFIFYILLFNIMIKIGNTSFCYRIVSTCSRQTKWKNFFQFITRNLPNNRMLLIYF